MLSHANPFPVYPLAELERARNDFIRLWHNALDRDPYVRALHELHYRFPPNVRMINCITYPFANADNTYQMPPLPRRSKRALEPRLTKKVNPKYPLYLLPDFCKSLSEAATSEQYDVQFPKLPISSALYKCDYCEFDSADASDSEQHLKQEQHTSCSEFALISDPQEGIDTTGPKLTVLCQPRALYNAVVPSLSWIFQKRTVMCPTCYLVLPDKLMCAYHHQSQHDGHHAKFAYGSVLVVRELEVCSQLRCVQCEHSFETIGNFTDHWMKPDSPCTSPFLPITSDSGEAQATQVVQVYCHVCRAHFDRIVPLFRGENSTLVLNTNLTGSAHRKRKRFTGRDISSSLSDPTEAPSGLEVVEWVNGFARFCVNHACLHLSSTPCKLQVRIVCLDKTSIDTFPPYFSQSDRELMLFCMHECKRLLTYLEHLRTTRRSLQRRTKNDLKRLMALASAYEI
ncbi:hypothetical protein EG68_05731 [Paragonimus skrjabini miyazakii]|uniref:C2H2-type domain-containing protein n=1 Tax=Paragonimus skrjabini miyazakii TaxID=59628 RepID=A0A8S9YMT6_9TREM|nr:hypothetical protein EG68_05731 [Paragonimus skrjabini miyazakii]